MSTTTTPVPKVEVLIRTDSLRRILDEEPEVRLKLQNMAIEKIAEELKRKAQNISLLQFESEMQSTIRKSIDSYNKSITSTYKFPPEAKAIIETLVKEAVQTYFAAEIRRWEASVNEFFANKQSASDRLTQAKVMETIEMMRPAIRQQAREEFVATLEAVKGKA
jgi:hypothetical protein